MLYKNLNFYKFYAFLSNQLLELSQKDQNNNDVKLAKQHLEGEIKKIKKALIKNSTTKRFLSKNKKDEIFKLWLTSWKEYMDEMLKNNCEVLEKEEKLYNATKDDMLFIGVYYPPNLEQGIKKIIEGEKENIKL